MLAYSVRLSCISFKCYVMESKCLVPDIGLLSAVRFGSQDFSLALVP